MEELNKSQIVLLTLLVSFTTSLATGIVTVSLMEQGVTPVYSTVNKIVERTKEIIVKIPEPQDPIVITETKEVIIHQSDLVAAAVAKNKGSSIIIYQKVLVPIITEIVADTHDAIDDTQAQATSTSNTEQVAATLVAIETLDEGTEQEMQTKFVFTARGVVLLGGVIATDASVLDGEGEYMIKDIDGNMAAVVVESTRSGVALLKVESSVGKAAVLGDATTLSRGQALIVLLGTDRLRVITAIVSDILKESGEVVAIEIDKNIVTPGSMLVNTDGKLVGISTGNSRTHGDDWFTPSNSIRDALE